MAQAAAGFETAELGASSGNAKLTRAPLNYTIVQMAS